MIGLLFATLNEAAPLLEKHSMTLLSRVPYELYKRGQLRLIISGMGPAAARSACTHLIQSNAPSIILNAGICGSLSDTGLAIGDLAICDSVCSDSAPQLAITLQPPPDPLLTLWNSLPHARLVSVSRPVFGGPRRNALTPCSDLVDMEGFAVADVCKSMSTSCLLLKGISDFADTGDRTSLHNNLTRLCERIAIKLLPVLP